MSPALLLAMAVAASPARAPGPARTPAPAPAPTPVPAENAAAKQGPILFGGGETAYLLMPPYQPGAPLSVVTVKLDHPAIVGGRGWDDSSYRFLAGADPTTLRVTPGQRHTGTIWRFGAQFPDGSKAYEGVKLEVVRVDSVPSSDSQGLRYRGFGKSERFYIVHSGKAFVQVLRTQASSELTAPPEGLGVQFDRPGKTAATRLLPTEASPVRLSNGQVLRLVGQSEVWFADGGPLR